VRGVVEAGLAPVEVEQPAKCRHGDLGKPVPTQPGEHHSLRPPEVHVWPAGPHQREAAQPGGAEVALEPLTGGRWGGGIQQRTTVLRHEAEQQPVYEPQQRTVVLRRRELPRPESLDQPAVRGGSEKSRAEGHECLLDTLTQLLQGTGTRLDSLPPPCLEPAVRGRGVRPGPLLQPGDMTHLEEQQPVGVQLAVEDRFQVELHIRGASKRGGVAEEPQPQPVREDGPQVVIAAIQQFLHHGLRGPCRAGHAGVAAVEVHARPQQVHRDVTPGVRDGVFRHPDLDAVAQRRHLAVPEFAQQRQQPALARRACARPGRAQCFRLPPRVPRPPEVAPRPRRGVADRLGPHQVVGPRRHALPVRHLTGGDAREQARGHHSPDNPHCLTGAHRAPPWTGR